MEPVTRDGETIHAVPNRPALPFHPRRTRSLFGRIRRPNPRRTWPKFPKDEAGFSSELRRRTDAYFVETGKSERDCWQMYLKTAVILAWLATSYALLVFAAPTVWLAAPLSISLALAISAVGFSIQHDGGHHAYSRYGWVNRLAALSLDLIGASSYLWRWKHVVFHHTYPNVDGPGHRHRRRAPSPGSRPTSGGGGSTGGSTCTCGPSTA